MMRKRARGDDLIAWVCRNRQQGCPRVAVKFLDLVQSVTLALDYDFLFKLQG
jgi:hypothetical protein